MAREALSRVMRFGRIAGWGVARGLIQSRDGAACKDAYLFIEDYMEGWRTTRSTLERSQTILCT